MTTERRDREVGAGYDYQWDVATFLLLAVVFPHNRTSLQSELRDALEWLGEIERVHLEGRESDNALEDVNLFGTGERSLRIQVKETSEDPRHHWRPTKPSFVEFLNRIGHDRSNPERRYLFLSNGSFPKEVRALLASRDQRSSFYDKEITARVADEKRAPREQFITNAGTVTVCKFLPATPPDGVATDGVGRAIVNEFVQLRVSEPQSAYVRLRHEVMKWSIRAGGKSLTRPEMRDAVLDLLGLSSTAAGGPWVTSMVDYLKEIPVESQNWPSWSELSADRVWMEDPALVAAEEALARTRLALLVGGQGSGKTVVARTLGYRLHARDHAPVYWDFEHLGAELPVHAAEFWHGAMLHAHGLGCQPLVVLENVHLSPRAFHALLTMRDRSRDASKLPALLITTSRTADLGVDLPLQRLQDAMVSLGGEDQPKRGWSLLRWWLERIPQLDDEARSQIIAAVPWERYVHDFWALRLVLEALNVEKRTLRMWAVEEMLRTRLARTINAHESADDLLYLVSGLGRNGIATDLAAAARVLGQPLETIRRLAERANRDGLLSIDTEKRSCRFWHDSLADRYWAVFALERDRWAETARKRFGALAP